MQFKFLYGSESGTAEVLAMDMADQLPPPHTGTVDDLYDTKIDIFNSNDDIYVFVVATYGEGDYTITAEDFFATLQTTAPNLSGVKYAVFGLGDTSYADTYNLAAKNADALLSQLGATRLGDMGLFDASNGDLPEDIGIPWLHTIA